MTGPSDGYVCYAEMGTAASTETTEAPRCVARPRTKSITSSQVMIMTTPTFSPYVGVTTRSSRVPKAMLRSLSE